MLQAPSMADQFRFPRRGNSSQPRSLLDQMRGGLPRLKIHEDWGSMPAVIDTCLSVADELDFQVQLHTDTLNESGFLEDTLAAISGRTIHMYHTEGAGGGHAPDIIAWPADELPALLDEPDQSLHRQHVRRASRHDHGVPSPQSCGAGGRGIRESRIRAQTIAAEDVLHDIGAISMLGSDSQGMGRINEVICRTWQLARR
jgi:urease subunit alpha